MRVILRNDDDDALGSIARVDGRGRACRREGVGFAVVVSDHIVRLTHGFVMLYDDGRFDDEHCWESGFCRSRSVK